MKRTLIVAAVATATASFATGASAQSSVTLYGTLDAGLTYTSNLLGNASWRGTGGNLSGSRWGLHGTEDLGSGLKAIFTLESGFEIFNGRSLQGGRMFGRQAYFGLAGDSWGSVTAGRQYDSVVDFLAPLTANGGWGASIFAHPFDNDNTNNSFRVNNSVKYTSANYSGFKFGALYGFSNQPGDFSHNSAYSVGMAYNNGPVQLAAAYLQLNRPGSAGGAVNDSSVFNSIGASLPGAGGLMIQDYRQRTFGAGGSYAVGPAVIAAVWTHSKLDRAANIFNMGPVSSLKFDNYEINAKYSVTPAVVLGGMYTYTQATASLAGVNSKPKFHTVGLQADYNLSKRTDVYLATAYQRAINARADLFSGQASSTRSQVAVTTGLRHRF